MVVELLAALGAERMVVGTDGPDDDRPTEEILETCSEAVAGFADRISSTDITACIEFNWSPVIRSLWSAAEVSRRSGADNVGVLFDPAHYYTTPTKFAELTPENVDEIAHVHVDDMKAKPADLSHCNDDRALPGEGHLPLEEILGHIEAHGYEGYFSIELFDDAFRAMPTAQAAEQMYDSLERLGSRMAGDHQ